MPRFKIEIGGNAVTYSTLDEALKAVSEYFDRTGVVLGIEKEEPLPLTEEKILVCTNCNHEGLESEFFPSGDGYAATCPICTAHNATPIIEKETGDAA